MLVRNTPSCLKCGKPMKAIYNDMGKDFCGDTFSHWEHNGKCSGETKEYKQLKEAIANQDFFKRH